ncbi:MAG TPA: GAF domain-containing sensor histidine kinase [Blastocatellia bacterium]|nr:GAF domain-containing sensor histidine kinase [Blastocatellia bacterium]
MTNRSNDRGRMIIRSSVLLMSVLVVLTAGSSVEGADVYLNALTAESGARPESLEPAINYAQDGVGSAADVSAGFNPLTALWQRRFFIIVIGILALLVIITFERYRAARMRELNAALSESEQLTEQLCAQQAELGKANRVLALEYAVTRALVESLGPVEAAPGIIQTLCVMTGWDLGAIWDVDPQSKVARCVGIWQKPARDGVEFSPASDGQVLLPGTGLPARVLTSRKPHWVTNVADGGGLRGLLTSANMGLASGFGFPILVGREVIGIVELYSHELRQPEQELIQIMSFIGSHIGQLIQRKRAEDALSRSKEERLVELQRVRRRIATDLHDDVGSSLTKIALLSEAVRQKVSTRNKDASERLNTITAISNELVDSMSDIVWAINPQKDNLSDLSQRIRRFASDIFTPARIAFRFRAPGPEQDIQLGANIRREVFLIFKESINNIVKHSEASQVTIDLAVAGGWLTFSVSDNGKGFNPSLAKAETDFLSSRSRGGNGLASMRRRAKEMGGQFEIITNIGRGTLLSLRLPIPVGMSETFKAAIQTGGDMASNLF